MHAIGIEGPPLVAHSPGEQCRSLRTPQNQVAITTVLGREKRAWKADATVRGPLHADTAWQQRVGTEHPGTQRALCVGIEVHHLTTGVDSRVGASRAYGGHRVCCHSLQCGLQRFLNGRQPGCALGLPAREAAAVVFDAERDAQWLRQACHHIRNCCGCVRAAPPPPAPSLSTSSRMSRAPSISPMSI